MAGALSKRVLKATGVFGGVQTINILCSIVRTKIVALWVGTAGVGLFGIFNSALDLVSLVSMMGINSSGARDIARNDDPRSRAMNIAIVRRVSFMLGLAGCVLMFLCAPLLSFWSFGDALHAGSFRLLAPAVLFMCVGWGETAILQGASRLKAVARAGLWGGIGGTVSAVPLLWFYGTGGVVPVILFSALSMMTGALIHRYRLAEKARISWRQLGAGARSLLTLGFFITLSDIVNYLASYILMAYLNTSHGTDIAGLYQSGFTMINRYVGIIFTAIGVEYFPRLASVINHGKVSEVFVSHEMKLMMLMVAPLLCGFVVIAPWVVRILYSDSFLPVVPFVEIGIVGTIFRGISWCMAMVMLAKGDGRIYIVTEGLSAVFYVGVNMLVINSLGIEGMGYAYLSWYLFYAVMVGVVFYRRYGMRLRRGIVPLVALSTASVVVVLVATMTLGRLVGAVAAAGVVGVGAWALVSRK